jgi:hypothetical protein
MTEKPPVSAIITLLNADEFIEEAIEILLRVLPVIFCQIGITYDKISQIEGQIIVI